MSFEEACSSLLDGAYNDAIEQFRHLLREHGDHPCLRHNMALALECTKDFVAAAAEYLETIRSSPEYMPAYLGLANCCLYANELEEAHHVILSARDLAPDDPRPHIFLSEILFLRDKEAEAIAAHLRAVECIHTSAAQKTDNHVLCFGDFGAGAPRFYSFLERSLIARPTLPALDHAPLDSTDIRVVMMAHMGTAADVARRLRVIPRTSVFLVTIDDLAERILRDHAPNVVLRNAGVKPHEFPALLLHIGRHLLDLGVAVVLPAEDGASDAVKLQRARDALSTHDIALIGTHGDLVATPAAAHLVDPHKIPPLMRKGGHADLATFSLIFSREVTRIPIVDVTSDAPTLLPSQDHQHS